MVVEERIYTLLPGKVDEYFRVEVAHGGRLCTVADEQIAAGVDSVTLFGSTGAIGLFADEERRRTAEVLMAHVTDIAPGVVLIKEGAWFTPADDGTDLRGCADVLSDDRSAPRGANTYNTNQVEVAVR